MSRVLKRLGTIGAGYLSLEIVNNIFDLLLYVSVISYLGPYKGGVIMTVFALLFNYGLVLFYNRTKSDWLGLEWLRLQHDKESDTKTGYLMRTLLKRTRWILIGYLSYSDPFKAFVFLRGRMPAGSKFTYADWKLLFGVNLLGNLIWIVMVSGVIEIIKKLF